MPNDNVDLDDYLWGGAEIALTTSYLVAKDTKGNVLSVTPTGSSTCETTLHSQMDLVVQLHVTIDEKLSATDFGAVLEKFKAQLGEANILYGKIGIRFVMASLRNGDVQTTLIPATMSGTLQVYLSTEVSWVRSAGSSEGASMEDWQTATALVGLSENGANRYTLAHELGHMLGFMSRDAGPISRFFGNVWYDMKVNHMLSDLEGGKVPPPDVIAMLRQNAARWAF
jgi:hypothetical protein